MYAVAHIYVKYVQSV